MSSLPVRQGIAQGRKSMIPRSPIDLGDRSEAWNSLLCLDIYAKLNIVKTPWYHSQNNTQPPNSFKQDIACPLEPTDSNKLSN